jgi:hypothetical protein
MSLACVFAHVTLHLCFAPQFVISFAVTSDFTSTLGLALHEICCGMQVEINVEQNRISVYNNGDGVPVEVHKEEGVYVPEMIFGHLLTSSNYNDAEKKTTGGRNGYGAKLANIFSTEFSIETADGKRLRQYKQVSHCTIWNQVCCILFHALLCYLWNCV